MKKIINFTALAVLFLIGCSAASAQKKTPDYKITADSRHSLRQRYR